MFTHIRVLLAFSSGIKLEYPFFSKKKTVVFKPWYLVKFKKGSQSNEEKKSYQISLPNYKN